MSWGFNAVNNSGQVLISSETRNLHFVGKAALYTTLAAANGYGGIRHWAYRIQSAVTPMPFFSMPTQDYYGITAIRNVGGQTWEIEVLRSGTSDVAPEVFVFADPRAITRRGTDYGMMVLMDDGTPAFDSRLGPLVISGGASVYPPSNPRIAGPSGLYAEECRSDASYSLAPDNVNNFSLSVSASKPIYFFPSIAQAQREHTIYRNRRECTGFNCYGACCGYGEEEQWRSTYWAFYRSGIRHSGSSLSCGWITVSYGCNWDYRRSNSIVGIGIGGGSGVGGVWPYSNETLNLSPVSIIVSNGARYD